MFVLSLGLTLHGFLLGYWASETAYSPWSPNVQAFIKAWPNVLRSIGAVLLFASLIVCISSHGLGAGILLSVLEIMTLGSFVVVLSPLPHWHYPYWWAGIIFCALLENTLSYAG